MFNTKKLAFCAVSILTISFVIGCGSSENDNEDLATTVNKEGAVETTYQVNHIDEKNDVLVITNKIWVKNNLVKVTTFTDTIPSLGEEEVDTENSGKQEVKKDYEIYFTAK
jgi:hypothetical protein